jgi:hypothetical protein
VSATEDEPGSVITRCWSSDSFAERNAHGGAPIRAACGVVIPPAEPVP